MERLTERTPDGILTKEDYGEDVLKTLYQCYGAEPMPHYANCDEGYCAMEKLAEYEDLEEQGGLLKLPINPKKKIYSIEYCCGENKNNKTGICFRGFCSECERKSHYILEATAESSCKISEIGKTVFLTKSAAEQALREIEGRNGDTD